MTLNFIFGTAAELIKLHPLIERARGRGWTVRCVATGQSSTNLEEQARDFGMDPRELRWLIPAAKDLATPRAAAAWFARAWFAKSPVPLAGECAVVHGDTLSTLAGARVAARGGARVVHVEAGLRSRRLWNPFPEEITRRRVSRLVDVHVAPDDFAVANLRAAGVGGEIVCSRGNTLMDAVRDGAPGSRTGDFALVNVHRFENLNSAHRWATIVDVLLEAARTRKVVFIAHPQTRHKLESDPETLARLRAAGLEILDRVPFSQFMGLLKSARYLISDGGSNQEECSYLGIPCLLLREETERREGLDANCVLSRFDRPVIENFLAAPERFRRDAFTDDARPSDLILDYLAGGRA